MNISLLLRVARIAAYVTELAGVAGGAEARVAAGRAETRGAVDAGRAGAVVDRLRAPRTREARHAQAAHCLIRVLTADAVRLFNSTTTTKVSENQLSTE